VANTGQVTFTGVNLEDVLPLGVSYVSNSATIQLSGAITNVVSDRFDVRSFTNSNGTIPWLSGWQEFGEADGVAAGGVQVKADGTNTVPLEAYALQIGNAARAATRQADLSGHASATLSFNYRRAGLDGATDFVDVFISSNGWASSNLLVRLQGAAERNEPHAGELQRVGLHFHQRRHPVFQFGHHGRGRFRLVRQRGVHAGRARTRRSPVLRRRPWRRT
jgi:hypothetical protein